MIKKVLYWLPRLVAALILLQTLFFKFAGAAESVALFTKLGVEPFGRIGLGIVELVTAILLLIPRTAAYGAVMTIGIMIGAILSHFTVLGIVVDGDGGLLFIYALITLAGGTITLVQEKAVISRLLGR